MVVQTNLKKLSIKRRKQRKIKSKYVKTRTFKNYKKFFAALFRVSFNIFKHQSVQFQRGRQFPRTDNNSNLIPRNLDGGIAKVWKKEFLENV